MSQSDVGSNLAEKSKDSSPDDFSYSGENANEADEALALVTKHLCVADGCRVHAAPKSKLQTWKGPGGREKGMSQITKFHQLGNQQTKSGYYAWYVSSTKEQAFDQIQRRSTSSKY